MAVWTKVGNVVKKKKGQEGYFFVFNDDVKITINGITLTRPFLDVEKPLDKYDRMLASGKITEDEYAEKAAKCSTSRIQLELVLPPQN